MDSNNKNYEIDYLVINNIKKETLEYNDTNHKTKITMDIILKEEY